MMDTYLGKVDPCPGVCQQSIVKTSTSPILPLKQSANKKQTSNLQASRDSIKKSKLQTKVQAVQGKQTHSRRSSDTSNLVKKYDSAKDVKSNQSTKKTGVTKVVSKSSRNGIAITTTQVIMVSKRTRDDLSPDSINKYESLAFLTQDQGDHSSLGKLDSPDNHYRSDVPFSYSLTGNHQGSSTTRHNQASALESSHLSK